MSLLKVEFHHVLPKEVEGFVNMLEVIHALFTFHQYIVNVYFHGAPNQVLEDFVSHSLESGPSILGSEGRYLLVVDSPISYESYLVFVWWVHLDLIILEIGVHRAKKLEACHCLY